jgi:signal transduction histidine kinase
MIKGLFRVNLRTQLLIVMLFLIASSLGSLMYLQQITEDRVLDLIQERINGLSKAIEISMEQMTATGKTKEDRLKEYVSQLKKKGVQQVSIISSDQEVLQSSNPKLVGSKISVSKNEFLIMAKIGDEENGKPTKVYNAFVPVISNNELEGYINITMYFDDLDKLYKDSYYRRVAWLIPIFGIGVLLCIIISYRFTKPIGLLVDSIHSISQGRKPILPKIPNADISGLADSIDVMINKLEEEKIMREKLKGIENQAMLAQLASGIAHEIRNPINFISLSIDHLGSQTWVKNADNLADDLFKKMKIEIRRVNQMLANFLDLGRELTLTTMPFRIDILLEDLLAMSMQMIKDRNITIKRNYCEPAPVIDLDMDKIKSCFQNIFNNAADSMPDGGTLYISIMNTEDFTHLIFKDTGEGIQPKNLLKIFEPYFTTKKTGTGLGLAISKRIIEAHGGRIDISSNPGVGTAVQISIPNNRARGQL